jgi:hypothetical protein
MFSTTLTKRQTLIPRGYVAFFFVILNRFLAEVAGAAVRLTPFLFHILPINRLKRIMCHYIKSPITSLPQ